MDKESWRRGGDSQPAPRGESSVDELAKGLASGSISRRQAVRWMGGALLGSVLAIVPGVEAFAAPKPPKGRCPAGFVNCRGTCVRIESNPSHCGGCFTQCSPNEVCTSGQCCAPERICGGSQCCGADESCCDCGDGSPVCCPSGTYCAACGPTICCPFDQTACGGQCVSNDCSCCDFEDGQRCCPPDTYCAGFGLCCQSGEEVCGGQCVSTTCPEGQFFNRSTCQCEEVGECSGSQEPCDFAFPCGSSEFGGCLCFITAAGPHQCFQESQCGGPCEDDSDCPSGFACAVNCCGSVCYPLCGTPSTTTSQDLQGTGVRSG